MLLSELQSTQVVVYIIDATSIDKHYDQLRRGLSSEDTTRLERYTNAVARSMFLASRGALRFLLGQMLATSPAKVEIATHEHGKPYLPAHPELFFNISHSRDIALIAFAREAVGIDVEYAGRQVDYAAVMRRFFSESERQEWAKYSQPTPQQAFFRGWTRKEAVLKATGEGIAGLGHTVISFRPDEPRALHARLGEQSQGQDWLFQDFSPATGYQAAVALQAPALSLTLQAFSL